MSRILLIIVIAMAVAGCGATKGPEPVCLTTDKAGKAIVTRTGPELCGQEAAAWCKRNKADREEWLTYALRFNDRRALKGARATEAACAKFGL